MRDLDWTHLELPGPDAIKPRSHQHPQPGDKAKKCCREERELLFPHITKGGSSWASSSCSAPLVPPLSPVPPEKGFPRNRVTPWLCPSPPLAEGEMRQAGPRGQLRGKQQNCTRIYFEMQLEFCLMSIPVLCA